MISRLDSNDDGLLELSELQSLSTEVRHNNFLHPLRVANLEELLKGRGLRREGVGGRGSADCCCAAQMQRSGKRALQKLFAKYDLNRSGTLNAREVAALLRNDLGVEATEQQAQALIETLSGRVGADLSLADLLSLLQRLRCYRRPPPARARPPQRPTAARRGQRLQLAARGVRQVRRGSERQNLARGARAATRVPRRHPHPSAGPRALLRPKAASALGPPRCRCVGLGSRPSHAPLSPGARRPPARSRRAGWGARARGAAGGAGAVARPQQ